ncbi:MAG: GWxTD domain-containing protein, partial [Candidatus Aminicenantes bacterium]|nr:GWxTD domain-containing protein [Candidatus Aminicenantes bacterium]
MNKTLAAAVLLVLTAGAAFVRGGQAVPLPDRHRAWVDEEVVYIITPRERDVFLQLRTDKERDIFIEAFWKQRDPTPGTERNEFREEHYRRIQYADKTYGRSTPRPGWQTDRGRIYIILGPPRNVESYDSVNNVHPTEIWFYQGFENLGLPPAFNVIFFRRDGFGDYVLYSPAADGPRSLISTAMGDYRDEQAYEELRRLEPNLARQTLSLIPGENRPYGQASLASDTLMARIAAAPRKTVKDAYADALLRYKDVVDVEYTANYIDARAFLYVAREGDGPFLVHYSIEPAKLTLAAYGGRNSAGFELNGRVADAQGRTLYQFEKTFPVDLDAEGLDAVRATSLEFQDVFPCVPGRYSFDLLLKNTVSKEFGSFSAVLDIPEPQAGPVMGDLFLGYGAEPAQAGSGEVVPFRIAGRQLLGDARKSFLPADTLIVVFQAYGLPQDWMEAGRVRYVYLREGKPVLSRLRPLSGAGSGASAALIEEQPLAGFATGYYEVTVSLLDASGADRAVRTGTFEISPARSLQRPRIMSRVLGAGHVQELDYAQGLQWLSLGKLEDAAEALGRAFAKNPMSERFALAYAQCRFLAGRFQDALSALRPLAEREGVSPDVSAWLGRSLHAMGRFREAVPYYRDYLNRDGLSVEILNFVGDCHFQIGERAEALAAWKKSLEISPDQDKIRELVASL